MNLVDVLPERFSKACFLVNTQFKKYRLPWAIFYRIDLLRLNIVIEGNCDERGTADYNLALGELRIINVKKYLVNLGISENRITTISFGSERPLYLGSDEVSWAMNRRADLIIP